MRRRLTIALDGRIVSGQYGGVESVIVGLVRALSSLADGDERYRVLVYPDDDDWLRPHVAGNVDILHVAPGHPSRLSPTPPPSDGLIEAAGVDVMHFTFQRGFMTGIPTIYHPHDLQHVHHPEFFTPEEIALREGWYRTLCDQASIVAVTSTWGKRDLERSFGLDPRKVKVVSWAPPITARELPSGSMDSPQARLGVPARYVLYPAVTWQHKNHVSLLRALALLRADGLDVPLVAPGHHTDFFSTVLEEQGALNVSDLVTWPGFVSRDELVALYRGAAAVIIPTRFEAASAPMWEAFDAGVPVASSNVTSLPEQAGDAALLFDPDDVPAIANAIRRLWTDPRLGQQLVEKGRDRIRRLSWDRTARTFRAYYRHLGGRGLSSADRSVVDGGGLP